jgi:two-component system, NtrC family, sensor kinase
VRAGPRLHVRDVARRLRPHLREVQCLFPLASATHDMVNRMTSGTARTTDLAWICALYELGQKAANGGHPQHVRQEILEHIVRGLQAESGSIALIVDGTPDTLEIVAGTDLPDGLIGSELPRGTGIFGYVVATGEPLLVNGDAAQTGLPLGHLETRERATQSAMCWPLRVSGRTIGAVAVNRAAESPRYTVDDLDQGQALTSLLALVMANHSMHVERDNRILELSALNATMQRINSMLEEAQGQVIQSEKLASIGQRSAGVPDEINDPLAFALSNLSSLESYLEQLFALLGAYIDADEVHGATAWGKWVQVRKLRQQTDFAFLRDDTAALVAESRDGLLQVKRIVQDLPDFSRAGAEEVWQAIDVHKALDSALNIVQSEIKHKANILRSYGDLPEIECMPSRLNQVFLNLLVNAGHSIKDSGTIIVSTSANGHEASICVTDSGCGIAAEDLSRIFDPFFTTKPVGMGTGLGLSVSQAIMHEHSGRIDVESAVGRGTRFTVRLPLRQVSAPSRAAAVAREEAQRAA